MQKSKNNLNDEIFKISAIDVHTHLDSEHLSARGLHDVMLYHMVISDLYSAGCPNGARLSESPDEKEIAERIEEAIPYLQHIRNTSCYWLMSSILCDLYEWVAPITIDNWRELDERIRRKSSDSKWGREILERANVEKAVTEWCLRGKGNNDDILLYSLEWAFFMRNQWGVFDAPIYELEYAWQFDTPVRPLPVTLSKRLPVKRQIQTVGDVKKAMSHYCNAIPYDQIISTAHHVSTEINYSLVSDEQMQAALNKRDNAGTVERDIYASYLFESMLEVFENSNSNLLFQFSLGAEPLPFETDSRLRQETIQSLAQIIARHPKTKFHCYLSSKHANQALCTLCRELPNLSLVGYWWHNFFPCHIRQIIDERLDMLPINKQVGFFSDAYCLDWLYAKSKLVRMELTRVISDRIDRGQYTLDNAITIAQRLLRNSA